MRRECIFLYLLHICNLADIYHAAGTYKVMFGANAMDIRGTGEYKLKKAESWTVNNVLAPALPVNEMSLETL